MRAGMRPAMPMTPSLNVRPRYCTQEHSAEGEQTEQGLKRTQRCRHSARSAHVCKQRQFMRKMRHNHVSHDPARRHTHRCPARTRRETHLFVQLCSVAGDDEVAEVLGEVQVQVAALRLDCGGADRRAPDHGIQTERTTQQSRKRARQRARPHRKPRDGRNSAQTRHCKGV